MNSQNLDQEIKNAQDEFIKDLRKLEQHEHDLALQEAYEKELQQRYVLEATKNGQMIISQAERVNIADNSSPSTFEQTVGPQIQTLLDQLEHLFLFLLNRYQDHQYLKL